MEIVGKRIEEQVNLVISIAMDRQDYEEFEEATQLQTEMQFCKLRCNFVI